MGRHESARPTVDDAFLSDVLAIGDAYASDVASAPNRYDDLQSHTSALRKASEDARQRLTEALAALLDRTELAQ